MRIVSLAPSNTEILHALGCGDDIVACTRFCDYPEEAKLKPRIGGWLDINDGLVAQHRPDVVMTSTFVQEKIVGRYKKKGIALFHTDPKTLEQVFDSIHAIGKLVDKEEEANDLADSMKKGFNDVTHQPENQPEKNQQRRQKEVNYPARPCNEKIKAYCEEWHKPPTVSGNWVPGIIEIAGGISLCPEGKVSHPVSLGEVGTFDPDCIVVSICGMGTNAKPGLITDRKGWDSLRAVRQNSIFVIDDSLLNRPGPRLVEGARQLHAYFSSLR